MTAKAFLVRPFMPEDGVALIGVPAVFGPGPAFTATVNDEVAACAGVVLASYAPWGTAWALLGPLGRQHGMFVSRAVKRGLAAIIADYGLVRVEADVLAHFPAAMNWLEWLGFAEEGYMPKRGPKGEDMIRYALFPKAAA